MYNTSFSFDERIGQNICRITGISIKNLLMESFSVNQSGINIKLSNFFLIAWCFWKLKKIEKCYSCKVDDKLKKVSLLKLNDT